MAEFVQAATLARVPAGTGITVTVGDTDIALFNVGGTAYAINGTCKHAGAALGSGGRTGPLVRCRAQGWKYDVTTGFANGIEGFGVACYPAEVVDGNLFIAVD